MENDLESWVETHLEEEIEAEIEAETKDANGIDIPMNLPVGTVFFISSGTCPHGTSFLVPADNRFLIQRNLVLPGDTCDDPPYIRPKDRGGNLRHKHEIEAVNSMVGGTFGFGGDYNGVAVHNHNPHTHNDGWTDSNLLLPSTTAYVRACYVLTQTYEAARNLEVPAGTHLLTHGPCNDDWESANWAEGAWLMVSNDLDKIGTRESFGSHDHGGVTTFIETDIKHAIGNDRYRIPAHDHDIMASTADPLSRVVGFCKTSHDQTKPLDTTIYPVFHHDTCEEWHPAAVEAKIAGNEFAGYFLRIYDSVNDPADNKKIGDEVGALCHTHELSSVQHDKRATYKTGTVFNSAESEHTHPVEYIRNLPPYYGILFCMFQ